MEVKFHGNFWGKKNSWNYGKNRLKILQGYFFEEITELFISFVKSQLKNKIRKNYYIWERSITANIISISSSSNCCCGSDDSSNGRSRRSGSGISSKIIEQYAMKNR